jgi:hypothetical protein
MKFKEGDYIKLKGLSGRPMKILKIAKFKNKDGTFRKGIFAILKTNVPGMDNSVYDISKGWELSKNKKRKK